MIYIHLRRFKNPISKKPWKEVIKAEKDGSMCPQFDFNKNFTIQGSEDCLYLNVFTPKVKILLSKL